MDSLNFIFKTICALNILLHNEFFLEKLIATKIISLEIIMLNVLTFWIRLILIKSEFLHAFLNFHTNIQIMFVWFKNKKCIIAWKQICHLILNLHYTDKVIGLSF